MSSRALTPSVAATSRGLATLRTLAFRCGVARHTPRSPTIPRSSGVAPKVAGCCPANVGRLPREPSFGPTSTNTGRLWAHFGRHEPSFAKARPCLAEIGQVLVAWGQSWPNSTRAWPKPAELGEHSGNSGPHLPNRGSKNGQFGPNSDDARLSAQLDRQPCGNFVSTPEPAGIDGGCCSGRVSSNVSVTFGEFIFSLPHSASPGTPSS